jgi:hypothetical protein
MLGEQCKRETLERLEDSGFLGYDAASFGMWVPTFRKNALPYLQVQA